MRIVAVSLVIWSLLVACGSDDSGESAGDAVLRQFGYLRAGQFDREWEELHPAHQAIVSKEAWLSCVGGGSFDFDAIIVKDTYAETLDIPEIGEVETTAVVVQFDGARTGTDTLHEISTDEGWRWTMAKDGLDAYADGACP